MKPKEWQIKALEKWKENGCNGIVEAPTGTGKSFLGVLAYKELKRPTTLIIVPTIALLTQWKSIMLKYASAIPDIYIINTVRKKLKPLDYYDFVILDEIHHYASDKSREIIPHLPKHVLGLSARHKRKDEEHVIFYNKIPLVYKYSFAEALLNGDISDFELKNIKVEIGDDKRNVIDRLNNEIKILLARFGNDLKNMYHHIYFGSRDEKRNAGKCSRYINTRKDMLYHCYEKNKATIQLIVRHRKDKTVVFTEFTKTAVEIKKSLDEMNIKNYIYYSTVKKDSGIPPLNAKARAKQLVGFGLCENGVMVAVKALNEGVDIPNANIGIINSGTSTEGDFIQRIGRILRPIEGKKALLYQLYVPHTKDEDWARARSKSIRQELDKVQEMKQQHL